MTATTEHKRSVPVSRVLMDMRPGDRLLFEEAGIMVEVVSKSGRQSRLLVTAPRCVKIGKFERDQAAIPAGYVPPATEAPRG